MAAPKRYAVDWSDSFYPEVVSLTPGTVEYERGVTFTAAKRDIIETMQARIAAARGVIRETRALRADDVEN